MKQALNFNRYFSDEDGFVWTTGWKGGKETKQMKPSLNKYGYLQTVFVNNEGKNINMTVHRFIAASFLGECPKGCEVNHINGIKTDNRPINLEYITHSQNVKHAFDNGLMLPKLGSINGNSKLKEEDVLAIRKAAKEGGMYYGRKRLAEKYGVSECCIKEVVNFRRNIWGHLK